MINKKKRTLLCGLALCLSLNLVGCNAKKVDAKKVIQGYDFYDEHYETYVTKEIIDEQLVTKYWAQNIVIGVNKETNEVSRFIYYYGQASDYLYNNIMNPSTLHGNIAELFNLDNGDLLFFHSSDNADLNIGYDNLDLIKEQNNFYFLSQYYEDMEIEYKAWYTIDEINEIAQKFAEKNEKIKKLELSNLK